MRADLDAHFRERGVDGGAPDLDCARGGENTDGSLEGLEAEVLEGEDAVLVTVDA